MNYKSFVKNISNFPIDGILFRDIQPLLENSEVFFDAIYDLGELVDMDKVDYFVGIESRGFIFASALASINLKGFKMIRKAGKLPNNDLCKVEYDLEYGSASIEMQKGWGNVVIVDDVLATGGTIKAAEKLATAAGYQVIDSICLIDIGILKDHNTKCLISY